MTEKKKTENKNPKNKLPAFDFPEEMEEKVVAMLLFDKESFNENISIIKPEHFKNPILQELTKMLHEFFKKYNRALDTDEVGEKLDVFIEEQYKKEKKKQRGLPPKETKNIVNDVLDTALETSDYNYIKDKVFDFVQRQEMTNFILGDLLKLHDKKEYKKIAEKAKEIASIGERGSAEELDVDRLGDIPPEEVDWLWDNRIPNRRFSLIIGDPEGGKSVFTLFMASQITAGGTWPDIPEEEIKKGNVILLTSEDDLADTVRPRVDINDGDPDKIHVIKSTIVRGKRRTFNLAEDIERLEDLIKRIGNVKLIIIDPVSAYLGSLEKSKIDSYRDPDIRSVLEPLSYLAEKHKIAIIGITHLNKSMTLKALYRIPGSIGWMASPRSVWVINKRDGFETTKQRLFMPAKANLSIDPTSLVFRFENTIYKYEDTELPVPKVFFEGEASHIDVEAELSGKSRIQMAIKRAEDFLENQFEIYDAEVIDAKDVEESLEEEEIKKSTYRAARKKMGIKSEYIRDEETGKMKWVLRLPEKTETKEEEDG